jgi:hypothetical protein
MQNQYRLKPRKSKASVSLSDLHRDNGGGLMRINIHRPEQFDPIAFALARLAGDVNAQALALAVEHLAEAARADNLPPCFTCGGRVTFGAVLVLRAERDDPSMMMNGALCPDCSRLDDEEIFARAEEVLRHFWPDARTIDPAAVSAPGRT